MVKVYRKAWLNNQKDCKFYLSLQKILIFLLTISYTSILKRREQLRRPPNQRSAVEHKHLKSNLTTATRTLTPRTMDMSPSVGISMILPIKKALQNALK